MAKRKITLNVDENLAREVKGILASEGLNLSSVVEEFLKSITASKWIEELAKSLGLDDLNPLDPSNIPRSRPKGYDSAKIIREFRDQRAAMAGGIHE